MPSELRSPDLQPSGSDPASISARRQRWFYVGVYALIGGFLGPPLSMALNDFMQSLFSPLEEYSAPAFWAARIISLALFLEAVRRFIRPKLEHFRTWKAWPPLLLAVPLGFWIFIVVAVLPSTFWNPEGMMPLFSWLNLAISTTGFAAVAIIRSHQPKQLADSAASEVVAKLPASRLTEISIEELRQWLRKESPLEEGEQDMFSQEPRARRLAKSLLVQRKGATSKLLQTTVIQGPYGIGKTSLIRLIKKEVQRNQANVIFVDIDCWGFSNLGAQEHVLEKIIEALGERFDVLGMQQLPGAYTKALQESSGWIHGMLQMLNHQSSDPVEVLKCIEPVLEATDTFLVVVIEESDRNDHEFAPKKIEALLHRLRQVERVSFVLAATERSQIDFAKVAEKIEPLPSLDPGVVAALLARMINEWGDPIKSGIIVPSRKNNGSNAWSENVSNPREGVKILAKMVRTPRILKHVLREVEDAWQTLKGEVDLYDLLCVEVLRHCVSPIFDFAVLYHRDFSSMTSGQEDQKVERVSFMKSELTRIMKRCMVDSEHARLIFERIFPHSIVPGFQHEDPQSYLKVAKLGVAAWPSDKLQNVKSLGTEMYWQRLLAKHVEDPWPKDQEVLRDLGDLQNAETLDRVAHSCVRSEVYRSSLRRFFDVTIFNDRDLAKSFAAAVWDKAKPFRDSDRASWNPAFMWVREWLPSSVNGMNTDGDLFWYLQMLQRSLEVDLDDGLGIYECARARMARRGNGSDLKMRMLDRVYAVWSPEGSYLSKRCRHGFDAVLEDILYEVVSDGESQTYLQNIPAEMIDLILRDLREDANRMAPMVHLVVRSEKRPREKIDLDKTKRLFGDRWMEALNLMAEKIAPKHDMDETETRKLRWLHEAVLEALASAKVELLAKSQEESGSEASDLSTQ